MTETIEGPGPQGWGTYQVQLAQDVAWLAKTTAKADKILVPGFYDRHIHGAYGADFMTSDATDLSAMLDQLDGDGYESLLATTVTASLEQTAQALGRIPDHPLVAGVHLEGPFISPQYPGAQPPQDILDPPGADSPWWDILLEPRVRQVTLAPERPGADTLVDRLTSGGVLVAAGHTDATFHQIAGMGEKISYATHMFNAMRPLHHREPGAVGAFLQGSHATLEIIYDRHHLAKEAVQIALKCRYPAVIAVSDCTLAKGLKPGTEATMWGHQVVVGTSDVRLKANSALAGSASTLLDCFRNLVQDFGPETACHMCCIEPRRGQTPNKWVLFNKELELLTQCRNKRPQ